jgi:flavin reductase (NADH)
MGAQQCSADPDPGRPRQERELRELMTRFPTGVSVVTAVCADGNPYGVTCTSLTAVCLAPPTLLVCLASTSRTLAMARDRGKFAVNLLRADSRHIAERFAAVDVDRFHGVRWQRSPVGLPWLTGSTVAVADCTVSGAWQVGDHTVLLGRLAGLSVQATDPLLYGLRRYAAMPQLRTAVVTS